MNHYRWYTAGGYTTTCSGFLPLSDDPGGTAAAGGRGWALECPSLILWVKGGRMVERLFTVREVAVALTVGIQTVRRYIAQGHVKAVTLPGGYYRIPESEVSRLTQLKGV